MEQQMNLAAEVALVALYMLRNILYLLDLSLSPLVLVDLVLPDLVILVTVCLATILYLARLLLLVVDMAALNLVEMEVQAVVLDDQMQAIHLLHNHLL